MAAKQKPIFTESTDVPVAKSIGEIMGLLVQAGAVAINQELDGGRVTGLSFVIRVPDGQLPFRLPVRVDPVFQKLNGRRNHWDQTKHKAKDREQAERVAWRQLYWWMKSQLALIDLGMVQAAEVLLPYMLGRDGRTFFETHGPKLLAAPEKASAS
jgi:hypothetical protein